jgi:TRAP-type uncharacterized transport system substrate-binding protein
MPPGLPYRPPLAMKLWLARRFGRGGSTLSAAPSHSLGRAMSIESLEHMMRNRVKMFLRHTWLVTFLGTVVMVAAVSLSIYYFTKASVVRIAAGPDGSANARFVQVLQGALAKNHDNMQLQLVSTGGAQASAQAMTNGRADVAILPSSVSDSIDWPVIAILRQNVMAFIVPAPAPAASASAPAGSATTAAKKSPATAKPAKTAKAKKSAKPTKTAKASGDDSDDSDDDSSKFDKITQLVGKRVGIVTGNEASTDLLDIVLNHYGVPLGQVQVSQIDPNNIAAALKANQVDVLFVAGSATGQAISNAVAAAAQNGTAPTFLEIDQADGIAKRNPAFDSIDIDAGTFGGSPPTPDDSLKSLSFGEYLVVNKSFDHNTIGTLARFIYTSRATLAAAMAGDVKIQAPSTDKDGAVTVAPGALAYLTDNQQDFFDKYGNDIFYGMLIFPVFGSAIAAMASYLRSDSRTRRLRHLQRVLDLVRKVHSAQTLESIEQIQIEADNLVVSIIHLSEHEEFDETVRMSFSFALDQLRFAIAARRTAILDHMGSAPKAAAAA